MKSFAVVAVLAAVAAAQDLSQLNNLPACGKLCISNMLGKAQELGCASSDIACLCKNVNFSYGVRDCSAAVCSPSDMATVVKFGEGVCAAAVGGSGIATVTQTQQAGTSTLVVSTGTDSTGGQVTSTLGVAGGIPATGVVATITGTDSTGGVYTTTATITGTGAMATTTAGAAGGSGNTTITTTLTSVVATGNSTNAGGIATLTETDSSGSTFTTVSTGALASASGAIASFASSVLASASVAATATSKAGAANLAAPGAIGGLAGLILALL